MDSKPKTVIGLGEFLWDCFEDERRPGGAPANVAIHAQSMGARGMVLSRVGNDPEGEELAKVLAERGLDASTLQIDPEHATGKVTVKTRDREHPHYVIHDRTAWDFLEMTAAWEQCIDQADAICFGSLAQRSRDSRSTIHACLERGSRKLRVFDLNLRQSYYTPQRIHDSIARCNVMKLNQDEVRLLSSLFERAPITEQDFIESLLSATPLQTICVTKGAAGCKIFSVQGTIEIPGVEVEVVDSVGSGDAFTAGFTVAMLAEQDLDTAGRFANEVGALVAGRRGATPDLRDVLPDLKARLFRV